MQSFRGHQTSAQRTSSTVPELNGVTERHYQHLAPRTECGAQHTRVIGWTEIWIHIGIEVVQGRVKEADDVTSGIGRRIDGGKLAAVRRNREVRPKKLPKAFRLNRVSGRVDREHLTAARI